MRFNMKNRYSTINSANKQKGIALITVMVVLFVLTILGLAATDSSNFQALMVRNNQFRLEAFNVARAEIQDQLTNYARVQDGGNGQTAALFFAIDSGIGRRTSTAEGTAPNSLTVRFGTTSVNQDLALTLVRGCPVLGQTVGDLRCSVIQLDSDAEIDGTNIGSDQSQTFSFISL